jgi:hypothetical protein
VSWPCSPSEEEAKYYTDHNVEEWKAALAKLPDTTGLKYRCAKTPI